METKWIVSDVPPVDQITEISEKAGVCRLVGAILASRKFTADDAVRFLSKDMAYIYDPFLLPDMQKAVDRIRLAIEKKENITVYGDYDADGVTSCSLLVTCLKDLGAKVDFYIPERETEGYGMSDVAVDIIAARGSTLIITVDCGITAVEECLHAKSLGIDLIVTDHHECGPTLPDAVAVVDAKRSDSQYPFKELAGVGVALKLSQALLEGSMKKQEVIDRFCELVTIGTIADIAPLVEENRVVCEIGLAKLQHTKNLGIRALIEVSGLTGKAIDSVKVGFVLAPKINAVGRLENASRAIELFLTDDWDKAKQIAGELHEYNIQRQEIEANILKEAEQMLSKHYSEDKILVLSSPSWHHGVVGVVASRLTKKYRKPCILISPGADGHYKGSGRSIEGFSLYDALAASRDTLVQFGGHELAAGIVIEKNKIQQFRSKINAYAAEHLPEELMVPVVRADCELRSRHLNFRIANELTRLQPYGTANPQPVFYIKDMTVHKVYTIGANHQHLKLKLSKNGVMIDAIAFGFGTDNHITYNSVISVMCNLEINEFRGNKELQLRIIDIK